MPALSEWLATFAFSRRIKHAGRDFSDAVLMAELLAQLLPTGAVSLHNYPPTSRFQHKLINWETLNRKVLTPMRCELPHSVLEDLAGGVPGAIALVLVQIKKTVDPQSSSPSAKPPRSPTRSSANNAPQAVSRPAVSPSSPSSYSSFTVMKPRPASADATTKKPTSSSRSVHHTNAAASPGKSSASATSQQRPPSPTKRLSLQTPSSATSSSYSLRDFLPLPQDRPTPDTRTVASMVFKVHATASPTKPKRFSSASSSEVLRLDSSDGNKTSAVEVSTDVTDAKADTTATDDGDNEYYSATIPEETPPNSQFQVQVQQVREWSVSPLTFTKATSPLRGFTTTPLARHRLSCVDLQSPVELCSVIPSQAAPTSEPSAPLPPPPSAPPPAANTADDTAIQWDLCAPPTVFPRVQLDVNAAFASPPPTLRLQSPKKTKL